MDYEPMMRINPLKLLRLASYFDEISKDTGKYCFGIVDTISALEQGAVEKLIIWEYLDIKPYVFRNPTSEGKKVRCDSMTAQLWF